MELFKLFGSIFLKDDDVNKGLDNVESRAKKTGSSLSKFGNLAMGAGKVAAVGMSIAGTAAIAGGVAAFKLGQTFEQSYNKIRIGTGATGKALTDLKKDFKSVYSETSASMDDVSTAVADLNTRTGLAGKPLQNLATQVIKLSQITGEELSPIIAQSTRLFGDWSISGKKQSGTLDYLFKVSQSTGIGVTALSEKMIKFGAPLRQMGFDFEKSAALMGKWEKEGVNTDVILSSLRIGLGKMAKAGVKDTNKELEKIIKNIKEAGSTGKANTLAMAAFGAKAGPDMAAAIREGRFELGDLMKSLKNSSETINKAKEDTTTFSEKLEKFKHKAAVAFEPLGTSILKLANDNLPLLEKVITKIPIEIIVNKIIDFSKEISKLISKIKDFVISKGIIDNLKNSFEGWVKLFKGEISIKKMLEEAFGIPEKKINKIINAVNNFTNTIKNVGKFIKEAFFSIDWNPLLKIFESIIKAVKPIGEMIKKTFSNIDWGPVLKSFETLKESIKPMIPFIMNLLKYFGILSGVIAAVNFGIIIGAINGITKSLGFVIAAVMDIVEVFYNAFTLIKAIITGDTDLIFETLGKIFENSLSLFSNLVNAIIALVSGFIQGIVTWFRSLFNTLVGHSIIPDIVNGIINWFQKLPGTVLKLIIKLKDSIINKFTAIKDFVKDVFIKIKSYMTKPFEGAGIIIENIIKTITKGFKNMVNNTISAINVLIRGMNKIQFKVPSWVPAIGGKDFGVNIKQIPHLASGGIINSPGNVLVGERGPEILSLNRGAQVSPLSGTQLIIDKRAFEGAFILDDYGMKKIIDRIAQWLKLKGVVVK